MRARLVIELQRAADGAVVARGDLAVTPYWCRWDGAVLWIVGSAATPVGEDDITLDVRVGDDVQATVRSVAATIVYAARGAGTRLTTRLEVGAGASLTWQPEPVIVTARALHRSLLVADVATGGSLVADEVVVFGRSGEEAGRFASSTELRCDGVPTTLTSYDTSIPGWSGPGGTAGTKVIGTRVVLAPGAAASSDPDRVEDGTVVLRPEAGGAIATTLAADPRIARSQLDAAFAIPGPTATGARFEPTSRLNPGGGHEGPHPVQDDRAGSAVRL